MTVAQTIEGYAVTLSAAERNQLLTATEYALSVLRGERDGARLLGDVDATRLDALTDRLFLVTHAASCSRSGRHSGRGVGSLPGRCAFSRSL
jgi:hypothetical protein